MSQDVDQTSRTYDRVQAQEKWQAFWEEDETFRPRDDGSRERRYVLDMFPYPSGDLHMGHAEAYAMGDVLSRFWRLQGFDDGEGNYICLELRIYFFTHELDGGDGTEVKGVGIYSVEWELTPKIYEVTSPVIFD